MPTGFRPLIDHDARWIDDNGRPVTDFYDYELSLDQFLRGLTLVKLKNAANDAAAATAGVQIGELYRNGSVVQIRVT